MKSTSPLSWEQNLSLEALERCYSFQQLVYFRCTALKRMRQEALSQLWDGSAGKQGKKKTKFMERIFKGKSRGGKQGPERMVLKKSMVQALAEMSDAELRRFVAESALDLSAADVTEKRGLGGRNADETVVSLSISIGTVTARLLGKISGVAHLEFRIVDLDFVVSHALARTHLSGSVGRFVRYPTLPHWNEAPLSFYFFGPALLSFSTMKALPEICFISFFEDSLDEKIRRVIVWQVAMDHLHDRIVADMADECTPSKLLSFKIAAEWSQQPSVDITVVGSPFSLCYSPAYFQRISKFFRLPGNNNFATFVKKAVEAVQFVQAEAVYSLRETPPVPKLRVSIDWDAIHIALPESLKKKHLTVAVLQVPCRFC